VENYQRRPWATSYGSSAPDPAQIANDVGAFLRRLIPFPGAEAFSPLSLLPLAQAGVTQSTPISQAVPDVVSQQAASIVSQAASILDEEMARGVLAARRSGVTASSGHAEASNPVLHQLHDLVDSLAASLPGMPGAPGVQRLVQSLPASSDADPLAEVRPRATVKPGERATITMTLRNSETRQVRLVPAATDLLGSRGGRIACALLEFMPADFSLEPQEQRDLTIATTVPVDAAPGCYSGLLVVRGLDYLRALITIEVV